MQGAVGRSVRKKPGRSEFDDWDRISESSVDRIDRVIQDQIDEWRPRYAQVVPIEEYLRCVDDAENLAMGGEELLERNSQDNNPSPQEGRVPSADRQVKKATAQNADEDDFSLGSSSRLSSAGESLRMALMRFCAQHGLEKDGWGH